MFISFNAEKPMALIGGAKNVTECSWICHILRYKRYFVDRMMIQAILQSQTISIIEKQLTTVIIQSNLPPFFRPAISIRPERCRSWSAACALRPLWWPFSIHRGLPDTDDRLSERSPPALRSTSPETSPPRLQNAEDRWRRPTFPLPLKTNYFQHDLYRKRKT